MTVKQIGDLSDRITTANDQPVADGAYVLVVLNRALRGDDNPVIETAIAHGKMAHGALRDRYLQLRQSARSANLKITAMDKTIENISIHNFAEYEDAELKKLISQLDIDHAIAISAEHPLLRTSLSLLCPKQRL